MHLDFNYQDFDYVNVSDTVKLDWNKVWSNRGHTLGEGMISPDRSYFYLNIPKNSSSSIKKILKELNWTFASINEYPDAKVIVALRDPIKRWISGATEYLMMYHQGVIDNIVEPNLYNFMPLLGDKLGLSLLFDRMSFDDHTERQAIFLQGVNLSRCIWVNVDQDFNKHFSALLHEIGYPNQFDSAVKENSAEDEKHIKKRKLINFLTYVVDNDVYKQYNLKQWHWCDFKLIEQVKFYGK
jgi:hypothetical protein